MSLDMDREGVVLARPKEWSVWQPAGKRSVAIQITFQITKFYDRDSGQWDDWLDYDMVVQGAFWIIGKDGQPLAKKVEQLAQCLGWDGDLMQVVNHEPPSIAVQVTVKEDAYEGQVRYRADWIAPEGSDPTGGGGGATPDQVKAITAQFGSLLRAAASAAKKGRVRPAAPPPPKPAPKPEADVDYGNVPF